MAGHVMYYRGYRGDRFWGSQGHLMPTRANWLHITDAYDHPLKGAAVYVYHVSQAPVQDSGAKYFADRPKFVGQTDDEGRFVFPPRPIKTGTTRRPTLLTDRSPFGIPSEPPQRTPRSRRTCGPLRASFSSE